VLALKYCTEREAEAAQAAMNNPEVAARVLAFHETDPEDAIFALRRGGDLIALLPPPPVDYGEMTLREYQQRHYAEHRAKARPRSWKNEARHWRRILEGLGDLRLGDIEPRVFVRWARDLRHKSRSGKGVRKRATESAPPVAGAYLRLLRSALQALLTYAYVEGHLDEHVHLGEVRIEGATKRAHEHAEPLDLDEVKRLLAVADPVRRAMWAVGVGQGLRPSELVRVDWSDIDWNDRVMRVRGTKTDDSAATIPMTPLAFTELRTHWMHLGQPAAGPCFLYKGRPVAEFKKALAADVEAAKLGKGRRVYPYLLRHSFATLAWSFGIDKDVARRVLRHTDLTMLDQVYCRPRPADLVARVAAFDIG